MKEIGGDGSSPHFAPDAKISCYDFLPEQCFPHLIRNTEGGGCTALSTLTKEGVRRKTSGTLVQALEQKVC